MDNHSWCFLNETVKLASNTASFSFVANVDTNLTTCRRGDIEIEVLQASLAKAILPRLADSPVYRVSSVNQGARKPKAEKKLERKLSELKQRQYRHPSSEAKMNQHKSWVDNDAYDLVDMRKTKTS